MVCELFRAIASISYEEFFCPPLLFLTTFPPFCQKFVRFLARIVLSCFVTNTSGRKWRTGYGTIQPSRRETPKPFSCSPFVECNEPCQGDSSVETTGRKDQMDGSIRFGTITYRERRPSSTPSAIPMYLFPIAIIIDFPRTANVCVEAFFFFDQ